jgi:hypothetical protein
VVCVVCVYGLAQNRRPVVPFVCKTIIMIILSRDNAEFFVVPPSSRVVPN